MAARTADNTRTINKLRDGAPIAAASARPKREVNDDWRVSLAGELERPQFALMPEVEWEKLYRLRMHGMRKPPKAHTVGAKES
jgi:hypothetical protein